MSDKDAKIIEILQDIQPEFDFANETDFVAQGFLDSFDIVTLVSELENTFNIIISALDIIPENFSSVENIGKLVEKSPKANS